MKGKELIGIAILAVSSSACNFDKPEPSPISREYYSYIYRLSISVPKEEVVQCYSDKVKYPKIDTSEGKVTDIVMVDVFCPDQEASEKLFHRNINGTDLSFLRISPEAYIKLEFLNQRSTYGECGLPVPSPFTVAKNCGESTS